MRPTRPAPHNPEDLPVLLSRREFATWLAVLVGGGLELRYDWLRVLTTNYKENFQLDSDSLVYATLADGDRGLLDPMVRATGEDYTSQVGLHGMVMALVTPGASLYQALRLTTALLLAAVLATAIIACWRAWGGRAATVLGALLFTAPWLNAFGASAYWQLWTFLLPMLVPLLVWPRLGSGRRKWIRGGLLIGGLVFLKCLCGYEFITTLVLGVAAVVAFHEFRERFDRQLLLRLVAAMAAAVAGFVAAMGVHAVQLQLRFGNLSALGGAAGDRTFWPTKLEVIAPRVYKQSGPLGRWLLEQNEVLGVWLFRMRYFLSDPAVALPAPQQFGLGPLPFEIPIYLFVLVWAVLARRAFRGKGADAALQRRLAVAAGISLAGALSWLVLAYGHMIVHFHVDAIVFYLPFLPLVFAMIALRVATATRAGEPARTAVPERPPVPSDLEDAYAMNEPQTARRIPVGASA